MNIEKIAFLDYKGNVPISGEEIDFLTYGAEPAKVLEIFRQLSPEQYKGIIDAYANLTIPRSRKAGIRLHDNFEQYIKRGIVERFASAKLEGCLKKQPDIRLEIWHPESPEINLFYENELCKRRSLYRCKAAIDIEYQSFTITRRYARDYERATHNQHERNLLEAVKDLRGYLPELNRGGIYRYNDSKEELVFDQKNGEFVKENLWKKIRKILGVWFK